MPADANPKASVLNSWKEIAAYLGRGVRTVQRYERDLGLPVRRPRGTSRSAVIALSNELDAWLCTAPTSVPRNGRTLEPAIVIANVKRSISDGTELRDQCHSLRTAHAQAIGKLLTNLTGLVETVHVNSSVGKKDSGGDIKVEHSALQVIVGGNRTEV